MRRPALPRSLACATVAFVAACGPDLPTRPVTPATDTPRADRAPASDPTPTGLELVKVGTWNGGGPQAAEITAFDPVSKRLFVVNGALGTVDVLDLRDPSAPTRVATLSVAPYGVTANSVAAHRGVVAVAVEAADRTSPGTVVFYRATTLKPVSSVTVGALPDMLTFTPSGRHVVVANEGEPNATYTVDPEGSVSIIDVSNVNRPTVRTATFTAFNGQAAALRAAGVRIFGPGASVAQDLEPEYVAVAEDGRTAWVTLQENNALAVVDLASATVTKIAPLGYKSHEGAGRGLDVSDRDNAIRIRPWPVLGMYQPDAIAAYSAGGQTYLVTANEGDARDYPAAGFSEEERVGGLLEPAVFTPARCGGPCAGNANLGRLTVTRTLGKNAQGRYAQLYAFGARSISVWNAAGQQVWDSGDELEQRTAQALPMLFNAGHEDPTFDSRSDNKGPEPEGVVLGRLGAKTFAFVGLERVGGVIVYDVTTPAAPSFVTYVNTRAGAGGDLGPEGLTFVRATDSPSKRPLLIVGHEVSGTTAIFEIVLR
ncbi:MAG TPA: choice-of-anchor I family protein [Gemmatirosa sp.]|nr:choice-of-anchor I family protein [Gemmatirosa sp.]